MFESDAVLVRVKRLEEYNQSLVVAHKFQMGRQTWDLNSVSGDPECDKRQIGG
ncbi:unnamed protein product [Brassica rapa subsp. narinosa]